MLNRCEKCGHENTQNHRFCGMCGAPLEPAAAAKTQTEIIQPARRDPLPVSGPSFLGLAEEPRSNVDYLLEDEEAHTSHWRLYAALALLLLAGAVLWMRWQKNGYPWAPPSTAVAPSVPAPSESQAPPPAAESNTTSMDQEKEQAATSVPPAGAPVASESASSSKTVPSPNAEETVEKSAKDPSQGEAGALGPRAANAAAANGQAGPASEPAADQLAASGKMAAKPASPSAQDTPAPAAMSADDKLAADGEKYLYGNGVPENCGLAMRNLSRAAGHSNPKAEGLLGAMYATGHCATRDLPTAYRWFALALRHDESNGRIQQDLEVLWKQMDSVERQRAISMTQGTGEPTAENRE